MKFVTDKEKIKIILEKMTTDFRETGKTSFVGGGRKYYFNKDGEIKEIIELEDNDGNN